MWNVRGLVRGGKYIYAIVPEHPKCTKHGYVLYHRILMENKIKRQLYDTEVVHHIHLNPNEA